MQVNEVRVKDVRERPKLLLESIEVARVEVHQGLERDPLLSLAIEYLVDDAHTALAEAAQDFVAGGSLPCGGPVDGPAVAFVVDSSAIKSFLCGR